MDLQDDEKSRKLCEHPHNSRHYETNAGQLFVKNINPFDTVGGNAGDVRNKLPKRKFTEFINIYDNKPNKMPSKDHVHEMYTLSNNYKEHMSSREKYNAYHGGHNRPHAQSLMSMSANTFNTQYSFCSSDVYKPSRYDYQMEFNDYDRDNNRYGASSPSDEINDYIATDGNEQCENDTYCPSLNQDFVYKTMQRNARLQKIVRKLVIEREREKQREAWNNYINDLKNKHRYYSNEPSRIVPQYVPGDHNSPEMIDDFYNMRVNWRQSNPCQHLLEGIYAAQDNTSSNTNTRYPHNYDGSIPSDARSFIYDNDRCSYPSGSQGSMIRLNKERQCYALNLRPRPSGRHFHGNNVMVDNNREHGFDSVHSNARPYLPVPINTKKPRGASASIVTANLPLVDEEDYREVNASNAEMFQEGNNIYFPYCTEEITPEEDTLEPDQYILVPIKHKSLRRYLHASAPLTHEPSKLDKDVNVPSFASLKSNKDFNNPNKLTTFKNKMVEKACNVRRPLKIYEANNLNSEKNDNFKENFKKVSENINKLKAKIRQSEEDTKVKSLATIEEKIDCLMKSMNSIMSDIQEKRNTLLAKRSAAVSACKIINSNQIVLNRHSSDPYNYKNVDYTVQDSSRSLTISELVPNELRRNTDSNISKMERILIEEMEKSDKAKSDIEKILNRRNDGSCSLQITFDIPTKEISTEVTDSLSKARCKSDEMFSGKITPSGQRGMTIAVNTDPLGLFALLRVSTETVKQILSYMPTLNYQSYLSLLPLLLPVRRGLQHFICNICGASFSQPSQLSAHVKQHNLGKTRDCCVCRHALDSKCARAPLFKCRYCGQRFTRAYCCELHQKSCARQLGRAHDVTSSHVLLH